MSKAAHVRKFLLLPTDFSLAGGELTPTLKVVLAQVSPSEVEAKSYVAGKNCCSSVYAAFYAQVKRHVVSEKYSAQIDEMYQHEEISSMW